jgi:hypothetical protein
MPFLDQNDFEKGIKSLVRFVVGLIVAGVGVGIAIGYFLGR